MCGIFGHTGVVAGGLPQSREALDTLAHRGPDRQGEWSDDQVYMGHRRLSIVDLSDNARQPFVNRSGTTVLCANGEIYNFRALRAELQRKYEFSSRSDSEVLLHGYDEWGIEGLLRRIEGMFAFVIYDVRRALIFLARDRVGIKPLYYSTVGDKFAWASELKALQKLFSVNDLVIDKSAVFDFFTYLYVPSPKTLYRGIFKLMPAHYLEVRIRQNRTREVRYWELPVTKTRLTLEDAAEQARQVVGKAVHEQMYSDVPVGFFVSGGIDSSVVAAEASQRAQRIFTYCMGADDKKRDESVYAKQVSALVGSVHRAEVMSGSSIEPMLGCLKQWFDEPFADTSAFPTYFVAKLARQTCKVVLTGDGGDEIFGGYRWYQRFAQLRRLRHPKPGFMLPWMFRVRQSHSGTFVGRLANMAESRLLDDLELFVKLKRGLVKPARAPFAALLGIDDEYDDHWHFRRFYREDLPVRTRLQYLDFHTYLPDDILTKVDRATMATSLEARVPLLATAIIEFAFSLPEELRFHEGQLKGLLRYAWRKVLPPEILRRSKQGFGIPAGSCFSDFQAQGRSPQEAIFDRLYAASVL